MTRYFLMLVVLAVSSFNSLSQELLNQKTMEKISIELEKSFDSKDASFWGIYIDPSASITTSLDRKKGTKTEPRKYIESRRLWFKVGGDDYESKDEIVSVSYDESLDVGTIQTKNTQSISMMGTKIHNITETTLIFSIVNGEPKIVRIAEYYNR